MFCEKKKALFLVASLVVSSILLSGCSMFVRESSAREIMTKVKAISSVNDLDYDYYYVAHQTEDGGVEYYPTYFSSCNFDGLDIFGEAEPSRNLWYQEDWESVPTLYEGDYLVFKSEENIPEAFTFERYNYDGYTVGISNIQRTSAGMYYIDTVEGEDICPYSNAKKLLDRTYSTRTIVYSVGNTTKLAPGNFSSGGNILGLEKDGEYKFLFYTGSIKHEMHIRADTVALWSMEVNYTTPYTYIDGDVISIQIPEAFNSGYYRIQDSGLFRYVKGVAYDETTDFNIPNDIDEDEFVPEWEEEMDEDLYEDDDEIDEDYDYEDSMETYPFNVDVAKSVHIKVTFDETDSYDASVSDPVVKLVGEDSVITLEKSADANEYETTLDLEVGRYTIQASELGGRAVHFLVE